ncbi:MAG: S-adenosylmethionine decarboxylase proenzyme [Candidatus Zixiibacteriota bacterium]|nr:MAG: S-adenosylmethionine decarboxylase proenzyme [candidate division Zixibacteria bacterium]
MKILGRHLVAELSGCNRKTLDNLPLLEELLNESVRRSGATIVKSVFHRYNPQGVSGVVVIAESHISIHTWPEYGYAAVDFFTCGDTVDPYRAFEYLKDALDSNNAHLSELKRGMPSATDEIINHKPGWQPAESRVTG